MLDKDYAIVLVWLERNNGRVYLQDRSVVSSRRSTNSTQMGPGTRPRGRTGTTAFFCTDLNMEPSEIIAIFAMRWEMEVTFQQARAHLGIETQRQWSEKAITRTTPILLGIYSLVCLWAHQALETNPMSYAAAWYKKTHFTFSDAIAVIRYEIFLSHSPPDRECDKNQSRLIKRLLYALCFPS